MNYGELWRAMEEVFGDDERRKAHARQVTYYAEELLKEEPGDRDIVVTASILHDIGIPESIRKYGNANGPNQEKEGPPIARRILGHLGHPEALTQEVCTIIAHHHSRGEIDTDNFKIVYDADWLVNLADEYDIQDNRKLKQVIDTVFLTEAGRRRAEEKFLRKT